MSLAVINYDLFPGTTMSRVVAQVEGVWAGLRRMRQVWCRSDPIHLAGWSAGAHLAAMLLCSIRAVPIASLLAISGVYDLVPILQTAANSDLRLDSGEAERNSPMRLLPTTKGCPVSVVWGGDETQAFRSQSTAFADVWSRRGVEVKIAEVEKLHHYAVMDALGDETSPVFGEAVRLLHM